MDNLFLLLFLIALICLIVGLINPQAFSRFIKGGITRKKIGLIFGISAVVCFVIFGMLSDTQKEKSNQPINKEVNQEETQKNLVPVLAQHKVLPEDIHGTTRIIHVIVQPNITKDELIAINDSLIEDYSKGLTHLNIEYFDDEVIASDYFQKISKVSETESDRLFKHYLGTYTMNKTTGYNELGFNENNDWTTVKKY